MVRIAGVMLQLIDSVGGVRKAVSVQSRGDYLPDLSAPFDSLNLSGMSSFVMQKPKLGNCYESTATSVKMLRY